MTYDNYKLSNPQDDGWTSDEVTSCCGVEQELSGVSNCCGARFWGHTDICGECKEHADECMICSECEEDDSCYSMIEPHEYEENQREKYAEMREDY